MGMEEPGFWYTGMILSVLPAIDRGVVLDLHEIRRRIIGGDVFEWLEQQIDDWVDPTAHDDTARLTMVRELQGFLDDDIERPLRHNGLCLLAAFCTVRLQQAL